MGGVTNSVGKEDLPRKGEGEEREEEREERESEGNAEGLKRRREDGGEFEEKETQKRGKGARKRNRAKRQKREESSTVAITSSSSSSSSSSSTTPTTKAKVSPPKKGKETNTKTTTTTTTPRVLSIQMRQHWRKLKGAVDRLSSKMEGLKNHFTFTFEEGVLVRAVKEGKWVLLDEINLASPETLESISGLLDGGSICLTERGDVVNVPRHPNFRLFACMNPATDVGKKDLPPGLRNRFSEFWVDEIHTRDDLSLFVRTYLMNTVPVPPVDQIVRFLLF